MAARVLLLVKFCTLLCVAAAQDVTYNPPVGNSGGLDLALQFLNSLSAVPHLFRFYRTEPGTEHWYGVVYEHLSLKATVCPKGTVDSPQNCSFKDNTPLMDCVVCYQTEDNQIRQSPEPYVHCIQKPKVTEEIWKTRSDKCKRMSYLTGVGLLTSVVAPEHMELNFTLMKLNDTLMERIFTPLMKLNDTLMERNDTLLPMELNVTDFRTTEAH